MKRKLSALLAASMVVSLAGVLPAQAAEADTATQGNGLSWDMAEEILTHISDPEFPDYSVNVLDYGAVPNDDKLDTEAIQKAIDEVSEKGGGKVVVPSGTFDVGAIELKSNVNLCLEKEDTLLLYTRDITEENYPLVFAHYEGSACYNWSPFIYAKDAENIALTGEGTLDGNADADHWWNWSKTYNPDGTTTSPSSADAKVLRQQTDDGVAFEERIFGEGHYLRPNFYQVINCTNVLVEGVTFKNSPMWIMNPVLCTNFTARGVTVDTHGYNNDGCDPENCNYVLIEDCYFNTGDDCIAVKAGRNKDGRDLGEQGYPTQNLIIRNNNFANGHGGIAMGSEMSGGIKNLFADNNTFDSPNLNYALRFKTNAQRGGYIENVYLRNSTVKSVGDASVHATMLYDTGRDGEYLPYFKNITIENLKSTGGQYGIFMEAFDEVPITGLVLKNVEITGAEKDVRALNWQDPVFENVTINGKSYPRPVDVHVEGDTVVGETVTASAVELGGDTSKLTYTWEVADTEDGTYTSCGTEASLALTADMAGKYVRMTATDESGNSTTSMSYKVLADREVAGVSTSHWASDAVVEAASKGLIDEDEAIDLDATVTSRDVAKMLGKLWGLTEPTTEITMSDVPTSDPDYKVIAAVVEAGLMPLKDPNVTGPQGTLYNTSLLDDMAAKRVAFMPDNVMTREELGYISILACGVPYSETLGNATPKFTDTDEISSVYKSNLGAANYFGFMVGDQNGVFNPKGEVTNAALISVVTRIAEFNNM